MKTNNYKFFSVLAVFAIVAIGVVLFQACNNDKVSSPIVKDVNADA